MIHETAIIKSNIPGSSVIHAYVVIGEHVKLGDGVVIHPFVVIGDHVEIGDQVEIFSGACIGKEPKGAGATSREINFKKQIKIGDHCSIGPHAIIYYDVEIAHHTLIGDGASIREQCKIGAEVLIGRYVTVNYNTSVGNKTKIMDYTHLTGNMLIGENVFISAGVLTTNDNKMGANDYSDHIMGPVIENDVKIGAGAILLPDMTIGARAVIAAGAVVTKPVSKNTTVKGLPARATGFENET
jgi:acetyltransferase-like isoleucine patch superfamily enzyme